MFYPDSGFAELYIDERIHQSETLWFTIRASDPKARTLRPDHELEYAGRRYFVHEITKGRDDAEALVTVEAPAIWTKLADHTHVGTLTFAANALEDVLVFVVDLKVPGWTSTVVSPANPAKSVSLETNDASVLDIVRKLAKITGYEVEFDTANKVVRFVEALGTERGLTFTYGRNLLGVERRENPPEITRLYPFGKDRLGIVFVEPDNLWYVEDFSYYTAQGLTLAEAQELYLKEQVWSDESFIDAQELYDAALDRLAELSDATVTYTMDVVDLTQLTKSTEDDYRLGDTVRVTDDELHFKNIPVRIVRIVRHPLDPTRSEVELSYLPVVVPDPDVGGSRSDTTKQWELFASRNIDTPRLVGAVRTVLNRLVLSTVSGAEWAVWYSLKATATGTGTITIQAVDTNNADAPFHPAYELDVVSGDPVHLAFGLGDIDVPPGSYNLVVRAEGTSGGALSIEADGTALWVLARGTTQNTLTLLNEIRYDFIDDTVQEFTVPDDVSEITIEAHGGKGSDRGVGTGAGLGGMVRATFPVLPGEVYDVYVGEGGISDQSNSMYPAGGDGTPTGTQGAAGGGRSEVRPQGGAITDALIVAAGGGGKGSNDIANTLGGDGGFYQGEDAQGGTGSGATQTAGGDGEGATASGNGAQGQGGDGVDDTEDPAIGGSPTTVGGGGGDGYFGGGAGAYGFGARGGGGGSGWLADGGYDLEYIDGENNGHGFVIISWHTLA